MRRGDLAWLALFAAACADSRIIDVSLEGYQFEYGFVVLLDPTGEPTRVSPPFGIRQGEVTFGSLPVYSLEQEDRFLLITLSEGQLAASVPHFDPARRDDLRLDPAPQSDLPNYEQTQEGQFLVVSIPAGAAARLAGADGRLVATELPEQGALRVPIAPEKCATIPDNTLVPFAANPKLVEPTQAASEDIRRVALADEATALALTERTLYLVRRDEPFQPVEVTPDRAGNAAGAGLIDHDDYKLVAMHYDRERGRLIAAGAARTGTVGYGLILELTVGPNGFAWGDTIAVAGHAFLDVAPDGAGGLALLRADLTVVGFDGAGFTSYPALSLELGADEIRRIAHTGDPAYPLIAGSVGRIHLFDRAANAWLAETIPREYIPVAGASGFEANDFTRAETPEGERELWAAGLFNVLLRKTGTGPWMPYAVDFPPRFSHCADPATDYPALADTSGYDAVLVRGDRIYLSVRECTTVLEIERGTGCTALIPVLGTALFTANDLQALDAFGKTLLVGGEAALLYRASLE